VIFLEVARGKKGEGRQKKDHQSIRTGKNSASKKRSLQPLISHPKKTSDRVALRTRRHEFHAGVNQRLGEIPMNFEHETIRSTKKRNLKSVRR